MNAHDAARQPSGADEGKHIAGNATSESQYVAAHKPPLKWVRVLRRLLDGPLHRFDAEKFPVSDHCLPSTVSELNRRSGINITSTLIRLPGYSRAGAYVALYTLAEESREAALKLIGAAR